MAARIRWGSRTQHTGSAKSRSGTCRPQPPGQSWVLVVIAPHGLRQRGRSSPGRAMHRIGLPEDVSPVAPSGEQYAPGLTVVDDGFGPGLTVVDDGFGQPLTKAVAPSRTASSRPDKARRRSA